MIELNRIHQLQQLKILCIGDYCSDIYQYGSVPRMSSEAPVPIFIPKRREELPGMAANVSKNLQNLGFSVVEFFGNKSIKTRYIDEKTNQHLLRIDEDVMSSPLSYDKLPLKKHFDAIVISDYNKGFVSYELIDEIKSKYGGPIFMDTKKNELKNFNGIFIKINEQEYNNLKSRNDSLIVTLGDKGAMYKNDNDKKYYPTKKVKVVDVTGAGDTFLASFVYDFMKNKDIDKAIHFANKASMVTVQNIGVYAPTLEEIKCV